MGWKACYRAVLRLSGDDADGRSMLLQGLRIQSYVVSRYMGWRFVDRRLHQCSHHHQPTSEGLKMTGAQYRAARNHVNEKMRGISGRGLLPRPGSVGSSPECISYRHGRLDGDPEEDFSDEKTVRRLILRCNILCLG